ncbi:hypothetical protein [Candidatus Pelagibacter sp. HIMB123]|uniref:hypothetical protein n=1 Tax=Candidatus Pelagibacter sp. HIMB123 TaxID=3415413 RepID=UPI003F88004F
MHLQNYKIIEDLVTSIYTKDISDFGDRSYYPQILKLVSRINLKNFTNENLICENEVFCSTSNGASINLISRSLGLPRETVRRKVSELIKLNWLVRDNLKIYVSKEWRKKNLKNNEIILKELIELSRKI